MSIMRALFHWIPTSENIKGKIVIFFSTPALAAGVVFHEQAKCETICGIFSREKAVGKRMKLYTARIHELQAAEEERLCGLLDRDRVKKVSALKSRKERERSIFAGLLLRHAFLQAGFDIEAWEQAEIETGAYGKPCIRGYQEFQYGLSHSGDWAICAADTVPIGVDIQEMKPWKMTLAKRFYHEEEYSRLLALGETDTDRQTQEFYIMWTSKESAVKLSGRGIGAGISQYVTARDYRYIYDMVKKQTFCTRWYDILKGYIICVCSETGNFPDLPERVVI